MATRSTRRAAILLGLLVPALAACALLLPEGSPDAARAAAPASAQTPAPARARKAGAARPCAEAKAAAARPPRSSDEAVELASTQPSRPQGQGAYVPEGERAPAWLRPVQVAGVVVDAFLRPVAGARVTLHVATVARRTETVGKGPAHPERGPPSTVLGTGSGAGSKDLERRAVLERALAAGLDAVDEVRSVATGADGSFSIAAPALAEDRRTLLIVSSDDGSGVAGLASCEAARALSASGGALTLDPIVLVPPRRLAVSARERGSPAAGARLALRVESELGETSRVHVLPASGRLEVVVPDGAAVSLAVEKPGHATARRELEVAGEDVEVLVELAPEAR